jgi:hypothetical protein
MIIHRSGRGFQEERAEKLRKSVDQLAVGNKKRRSEEVEKLRG